VPYLIDGHNLIGAMPGISLSDLDDEHALVLQLSQFARRTRRSIVVYFDRASLTAPQISNIAGVKIHFVRPPRTADDALRNHIERLRREAPNWTVVSSDAEVRRAAQQAGARIMDSPTFASQMSQGGSDKTEAEKPEPSLSPDELDAWELLFRDPDARDPNKKS
jgi:predicted RNA-binding protein with PIN domain